MFIQYFKWNKHTFGLSKIPWTERSNPYSILASQEHLQVGHRVYWFEPELAAFFFLWFKFSQYIWILTIAETAN